MKAEPINKDQITQVIFPETDVITEPRQRTNRWLKLKAASSQHSQIAEQEIIFRNARSRLYTITSRVVVAQNDKVILSGGYVLPMRSIQHVR